MAGRKSSNRYTGQVGSAGRKRTGFSSTAPTTNNLYTKNLKTQQDMQQKAEEKKIAAEKAKQAEEAEKQKQLDRNAKISTVGQATATGAIVAERERRALAESLAQQQQALQGPVARPDLGVTEISRAGVRDVTGGPATSAAANTMAAGRMDAATIAQDPQAQFRAQQLQLAQALAAQARGEGPSLAQQQLQMGTEAAIAAQRAQGAGAQSALQARELARTTASLQQQQAAQAAQLRLQEQLQAQQALAGLSEAARGQDIGLATQQAMLEQEAGAANLAAQTAQAERQTQVDIANLQARVQDADRSLKAQMANQGVDLDVLKTNAAANNAAAIAELEAQLKMMGLNQQERIAYMQTQAGLVGDALNTAIQQQQIEQNRLNTQAQLATELEKARLGAQTDIDVANITGEFKRFEGERERQFKRDTARQELQQEITGKIFEAGASILPIPRSDENAKTNIKDGTKDIRQFLSTIGTHSYDYKNPERDGKGRRISPMAQELQKTEIGKRAVIADKDGLLVDYGQLLPALTAAMGDSHRRLVSLENALKGQAKRKARKK